MLKCLLPLSVLLAMFTGYTAAANEQQNPILSLYTCHNDGDCIETSHGCTMRATPMGQKAMSEGYNSTGNCQCLLGPVMYGCVPRDHNPTVPQKNDNYKQ